MALPDFFGWASLVVEGGEMSLDKDCSLPQWRAASQASAWSIPPSPQSCPHTGMSNDIQGVGLSH